MSSNQPPREELAPPPAAEAGARALDLREYLSLLWSYKWIVLAVTALIGTGVILWTLRQPKIYEATCVVEYDPNPTSPLGTAVEDVANPAGSFWMSREFFATQNRIISSRTVAERVVRELSLHQDPSFFYVDEEAQADWEAATVADAASVLQSRLAVEAVDDTRLVAIKIRDRDPERAATLANAVADAYIQKTLEDRMGSTVSALEWLGNQLDSLRHQLDDSELALHHFKEEHNVLSVSMEDRQNLVASDIEQFNEALTKARTRRNELAARLARVRVAARGDTPEESAAAFEGHGTIGALREGLRTKLSERDSLAARYGSEHQRMEQLTIEIDRLREHLREELQGVERAAEADLVESSRIESGLRVFLEDAQAQGLQLNLREIEYSRLNRERENNSKLYNLVLERTTETDLTRMLRTTHVRLLDRALQPAGPISPNVLTNAGGGIGAGAILGLALAFLLGRLDRRLKSVVDVEAVGLTILGILPRIEEGEEAQPATNSKAGKRRKRGVAPAGANRDLFVHTHPMSAAAECCRTIRTNLTFMSADSPLRTLAVTSASPREGKTTVATNIAISLAQSGKRILMVDTDLRRPRIHRAFGVSSARGLTSVVVGEEKFLDVVQKTDIPGLDVIPCGPIPPNPSELLHSARFQGFVEQALLHYDRVIFDSPPLGAVTDAAVLAPQLDAALIVVKAHSTTREALRSTLRQLRDVGAHVVGGVLNDVDPRRKGYGSGDDYYYYYRREGYYYAQEADDDAPSRRPPPAAPPS